MRNRWRLLILLAVAILAVGAVGTSGFTTTTADRTLTVDVVGDKSAYMSLAYDDDSTRIAEGESVSFVTVQNQFAENGVAIDVSSDISEQGEKLTIESRENHHGSLSIGKSLKPTVTFKCENESATGSVDVTVAFDVTADGDSVYAETTRERTVSYEVTCESNESSTNTATATETVTSTDTATSTEAVSGDATTSE